MINDDDRGMINGKVKLFMDTPINGRRWKYINLKCLFDIYKTK